MSDALLDTNLDDIAMWPDGFGRRAQVDPSELVSEVRELTQADVDAAVAHIESGAVLGVQTSGLGKIRRSHHRMAQLIAAGMSDVQVGALTNYSPNRIYSIKQDPAFQELIAHYAQVVDQEFTNFVEAASLLSVDALGELQSRLDENSAQFTNAQLMELVKVTADRSGNSPVQKSFNVNINAGLGTRMAAARERLANVTPAEGTS